MPDEETAASLLKINLQGLDIDPQFDLEKAALKLIGYSGADITNVCRDASLMSMRRKIKGLNAEQIKKINKEELNIPLTEEDFLEALSKISPSVSQLDIKKFEAWMAEYGTLLLSFNLLLC